MSPRILRFSITKKIAAPFALILILMGVMGAASLIGYNRAGDSIKTLENEVVKQSAAGDLRSSLAALLMAVNDYIITGKESYHAEYEELREQVHARIAALEAHLTSDEERNRLDTIRLNIDSVHATANWIFRLEKVRTNPLAGQLMEEMDYRYGDKVYAQVGALVETIQQKVTFASLAVQQDRAWAFWLVLIPTLLALGISSVVVVLTMQRISKPILQLVGVAQRIAARDFSVRIKAEAEDEIGLLIVAFNAMAEEINRRYEELEQFAYIVAHDLKSPLVGVRGMAEILQTEYLQKLEDSGKEFLRLIVESSDRMGHLINDLLEFARAGKVEFAKEPVDINLLVQQVKADLSFYLKEKNAVVTVQPNLPAVICDPVRFSQIWKNLISNSVKYNDKPAPHVEIGWNSSDGHYEFFVKDNGIGMDPKHFDHIFMPFQRATRDPKYEGTGIGLAIVKRVVEFHGGKVWVESRVGEGTTFRFTVRKQLLV